MTAGPRELVSVAGPVVASRIGVVARHTFLGFFALVCFVPYLWMVVSALKSSTEIVAIPPSWFPQEFTLDNFRTLFTELDFGRAALISGFMAVTATVIQISASLYAGYVFARHRFVARNGIFLVLLATLMVPFASILIPLFLQVNSFGWLNSLQGLTLPLAISTFGIFLIRQHVATIPDELFEAAKVDGASERWIILRIVMPLALTPLAVIGLLHFFTVWDSLIWPISVISNVEMRPLTVAISTLNYERGARYDLQLAASVLMNLPVIVLYVLFRRRLVEGMNVQGVK